MNGKRVLVAVDNPVNCAGLLRSLRHLGCEAHSVGSGGDALEAAAGRTWDMLLLDCETPGMDGCRTAAQIRRLAAPVSSVPIIAMTVASHPFAGRLRSAGIDDYLAKPVRLSDLAAALERWVPALLPGAIESA